jgi:5-carboxymethyl-2-hydroxymuconate isomerase
MFLLPGADMPQVTIEFSRGLEKAHDIQALCEDLFQALAAEDEVTDPATVKIRARAVDFFRNGTEPDSFAHATFLLLDGRDEATRKHLNHRILSVMQAALPDVGSLSVHDVEMTRATYAKRVLET